MTPAEREVLQARARALSEPAEADLAGPDQQVLRWERGAHRFGLPLAGAVAVIPVPRLAAVPHARSPLAGIGEFRGGLLPMYEPGPLLGVAAERLDPAAWAIVVDRERPLGILSDGLPRLEDLPTTELGPPGADLPPHARRCMAGVHRTGWVLLDPEGVRTDDRLTASTVPTASEAHP